MSHSAFTHLTPPERETVILTSDADDFWDIWTAQRPVITKLKANPDAELVEEGFYGSTAWASFRLPSTLITFRRRRAPMSEEQRAQAAERLKRARAA